MSSVPGQVHAHVVPLAEGTIGDAATFTVIIEALRIQELELLPGMTGRVEIKSDE